jgi:RNA polymerase sigma-70 factor, ECF subfamily
MISTPALREVFLSRWPPSAGEPAGPELDEALQAALTEAQAASPRVAAMAEEFVAYLAERADTAAPSPAKAIEKMHIADLGLCFACSKGDPAALAGLDRQLDQLMGSIARIDDSPAFIDEVKQLVRVDLLMARERAAASEPRIAQFRGRAPLRAWLRVIATRVALEVKGKGNREIGGLDELIVVAAAEDPQLAHLCGRHLGEFRTILNDAVSEALTALDVESRNLLRWHLVDDLSLRRIAVVRGDNVSAVSRQYARIRAWIMDHVRLRLKEHTGLPTRDVDSVMSALRSQISLSLSTCALLKAT